MKTSIIFLAFLTLASCDFNKHKPDNIIDTLQNLGYELVQGPNPIDTEKPKEVVAAEFFSFKNDSTVVDITYYSCQQLEDVYSTDVNDYTQEILRLYTEDRKVYGGSAGIHCFHVYSKQLGAGQLLKIQENISNAFD